MAITNSTLLFRRLGWVSLASSVIITIIAISYSETYISVVTSLHFAFMSVPILFLLLSTLSFLILGFIFIPDPRRYIMNIARVLVIFLSAYGCGSFFSFKDVNISYEGKNVFSASFENGSIGDNSIITTLLILIFLCAPIYALTNKYCVEDGQY